MKQELCLTMIVKNEAPIIARCLESARPFITSFSISDTGSTDGTQDIIRAMLKDIPGVLSQDEWVDFATNRNLALSRATGEYAITIDADETLWRTGNAPLEGDRISVKVSQAGVAFFSPRILRNDGKWKWIGEVHELPEEHDGPFTDALTERFEICAVGDGHQSTTQSKLEKAAKILAILERSPKTPRNVFYTGRTLYDLERFQDAIEAFEQHAATDAWPEEIYISLYQIAAAKKLLGHTTYDVLAAYERAYQYRPQRGEALHGLHNEIMERIQNFTGEHTDTLFYDPNINRTLQEIEHGL